VSRPLFVLGKYLGVAGALTLATVYLSFVFLLVEEHSVLQTVREPIHVPVIVFGLGAAALGLGIGIWCNFFYNKVFSSTVICITTPLAGLAYLFSLMFRHDFVMQPIGTAFKLQLWLGLAGLLVAILVLTAIAIAASTRLGQVMTLCVTVGVFMAGMLSDWYFGQQIDQLKKSWLNEASAQKQTDMVDRSFTVHRVNGEVETVTNHVEVARVPLTNFATGKELLQYRLCWVGYSIVPNFQVLWLSDAITQEHRIPLSYLAMSSLYGSFQIMASLSLAVLLFQRREVG
jgi:hypothetical protein